MLCKKCGGPLYWLKMLRAPSKKDIRTDYLMCEQCEAIYRQIIHTKIERKEIHPEEAEVLDAECVAELEHEEKLRHTEAEGNE